MIFSLSKGMYTAVLLGDKTLTTRLKLPAHTKVGREVAFVPGRAKAAWWLSPDGQIIHNLNDWAAAQSQDELKRKVWGGGFRYVIDYARAQGFVQTRLVVEGFWLTPLQTMTEQEARHEGVGGVEEYAALWDGTNKGSWQSNPEVWRLRFRRTDALVAAVERVGREAILAARDAVLGVTA